MIGLPKLIFQVRQKASHHRLYIYASPNFQIGTSIVIAGKRFSTYETVENKSSEHLCKRIISCTPNLEHHDISKRNSHAIITTHADYNTASRYGTIFRKSLLVRPGTVGYPPYSPSRYCRYLLLRKSRTLPLPSSD